MSKLRTLSLFAGIGAFDLGLERTGGFETVAFCEIDPFARAVLKKHWPEVPCYDDVRTLTGDRLHADGIFPNAICGGFPCQDVSYAGPGGGLAGERSGLWFEFARLIRELGPEYVIVENVAALLDRGMGDVLGTLSDIGYDAEWSVVSGCALGAPHMRRRVFIVAYPHGKHGRTGIWHSDARRDGPIQVIDRLESARSGVRTRLANPSALYRDADGVAFRMDRNHAIGNSFYWPVAEAIGRAIMSAPA